MCELCKHIKREIKRDTRRRNGSILETNTTIEDTNTHTHTRRENKPYCET